MSGRVAGMEVDGSRVEFMELSRRRFCSRLKTSSFFRFSNLLCKLEALNCSLCCACLASSVLPAGDEGLLREGERCFISECVLFSFCFRIPGIKSSSEEYEKLIWSSPAIPFVPSIQPWFPSLSESDVESELWLDEHTGCSLVNLLWEHFSSVVTFSEYCFSCRCQAMLVQAAIVRNWWMMFRGMK